MIAIDTNILVYAHREAVPEHDAARRAIERAASDRRGWGVALACVAELWMVATHPSSTGRPSSGEEVARYLEVLSEDAGMRVFTPSPSFPARLWQLACALDVRGPRIFDLQIGLTASDAGATEVWTHDAGFRAPPGLKVLDPLT